MAVIVVVVVIVLLAIMGCMVVLGMEIRIQIDPGMYRANDSGGA